MSESEGRRLLVPAVLLLAAVPCVQLPVTLYGGSPGDFDFGVAQLLPLWLVLGAAVAAPAVAVLGSASRRWPRVPAMAWAAAAWVWVSGNLIVWDFGPLAGAPLSFAERRLWAIPELALAVAVLWAGTWWAGRRPAVARRAAWLVLAVIGLQAVLGLAKDLPKLGALRTEEPAELFRFGAGGNVLVLLLDTFQGDVFAELVDRDPSLAGRFDGFELYANVLGVAQTTALTMPAVHTGARFQPGSTIQDYYRHARRRSGFLEQVAAAGHEVVVVNPFGFCPAGNRWCGELDRLTGSRGLDFLAEATLAVDLAIFRVAPLVAKRPIYARGRWLLMRLLGVHRGSQLQRQSFDLLRRLAAEARVADGPPAAKFIHLPTPHAPLVATEACELLDEDLPKTRPNTLRQSRCALELTATVVDRLRALQIFDDSLVIVMSDHGAGLPLSGTAPQTDDAWRRRMGAAHPLLLVKHPGAAGELTTNQNAVQIDDVGKTVCEVVPGCEYRHGRTLTSRPGPRRPRQYLEYRWRTDFWYERGRIDVTRWEVRGPLRDPDSWSLAEITGGG